jgi:hypothetical protein
MGFSAGMGIIAAVAAAFGAGDRPLVTRFTRWRRQPAPPVGDDGAQRQQWDSMGSLNAIQIEKVPRDNLVGIPLVTGHNKENRT